MAAGYSMPINVKFDRSVITKELRNLERALGKNKINIELNLLGGLTKDQLERIQGRLEALSKTKKVEIPASIKNGATGKDADKVVASIKERLAQNQQIKQGGGKLRIETSVKPSITNEDIAVFKKAVKDKLSKISALEVATKLDVPKVEDLLKGLQKNINRQKPLLVKTSIKPSILSADIKAFKKAVESKLSGITVKINAELETIGGGKTKAQIEKEVLAGLERIQQMGAERMGGGVTEPARRESLRQSLQGRDIGELKDIGKQLGVAGVGKFRNTQNLIERIVTEASIEMITKYLDPQAVMRNPDRSGLNKVLDTFARGLFNMLGMDVASMRQQAAQRRALPGINFPATVPSRPISIGPSGTGRALPPGAIPGALPGTAFGAQKYLPTNLGIELQQILQKAAYAFVDAVRREVRTVKIGIGASMQAALPAARIAGLLPSAVGRAPSTYSTGAIGGESREQMMARRTAEAYARSALRGMDVMGGGAGRPPSPYSYAYRSARPTNAIIPYAQPGAIVPSSVAGEGGAAPPGGGGGGAGGMGGMGGFGRALGSVNLPGAGAIRELGQEFAFATQQVLLFGQAYKMLAFIQNFPAQVGEAVSQLQNFRNTLDAISPTAEEAASSNRLILDLVEKYNVPLQSARDGFTKLYASMAPAGFSGDQVRDLFTGITQAAATFGMSADKVDRVNYAFAQMASKGQVMSEELKGQLGDVLPGAMAIFAEAAGFKGPKAIQDFSAALEDGAYKGQAMVALLNNVGIVMKQEFGPGAEGAARTFQGVINRMQNSMTLLYESFEPVAVGFLNTVVVPLTDGIKQISDGFNAFFTGTAAQTTGGFGIAQELERLRPAFDGIGKNVSALVAQFSQFAKVALDVGKVLIQIAGNPFVGYIARVYINVLALTTAIQLLNLKALIPLIASFARSTYALIAFTAQCARAGQSAQVMGLMAGTAGATLRTFFATTGVGIVLVGIGLLIERFMSMNQALADTKAKALGAADAIRSMSQVEARAAEQQAQSSYQTIGRIAGRAGERVLGQNDRIVQISQQELKQLESLGAIKTAKDPLSGRITARRSDILSLAPQAQRLQAQAAGRIRDLRFEEKQMQQQAVLAPIPAAAAEGKGAGKGKGKKERESQVPLLELELATTQQLFELEKQIMTARLGENELEVVRLNGLKEQLRFNEQIAKVKLDNELPAAEKALQIQRLTKEAELARLQTNFDLETKILEAYKKVNDAVVDIGRQSALEVQDRKEYQRLIMDGILPSTAKITIEVNRQFAVESEKLGLLQEQIKDQIAILEAKQNITKEDQIQLDILRQRLKETGVNMQEIPRLAGETIQSRIQAEAPADPNVSMRENIASLEEEFKRLYSWQNQAVEGSKAIGAALGEAMTTGVTGLITGTASAKEVFASFLQSVGQALSQAASQMIATYIAIGIAKMFAGLGGGGGNPAGSGGGISDILPGASQYMEGGGAALGASAGTFGAVTTGYANGGIVPGGFRAFANGGVVSGPTLGLVGEGKYNEAVVPLPDGRSIPVQLGGRSARDLMGNGAPGMPQAPSLSMKFETTKINGVEYVSREQLEQAMAETRRASIAGGAQRGMSMTLDKIKQSPSTRSRIGIR